MRTIWKLTFWEFFIWYFMTIATVEGWECKNMIYFPKNQAYQNVRTLLVYYKNNNFMKWWPLENISTLRQNHSITKISEKLFHILYLPSQYFLIFVFYSKLQERIYCLSVEVHSIAYFGVGRFGLTVGDFDGRKRPYLQKIYMY